MAVQKSKKSRSRRDMRRSHDALSAPAMFRLLVNVELADEMSPPLASMVRR